MMQQLVRLILILLAIFILRSDGIRIRGGSSSYTYDPRNPGTTRLTCEQDNGFSISSASWSRNGVLIEGGEGSPVQSNGRLALNQENIGTEDPQSFEGLYRCHNGDARSDPVAFFVVPRRSNVNTTVQHQLESSAAINCSLHFGSLRKNWTVSWTAEDKARVALPTNGYEIQTDPLFHLVIKNATVDYDGAKFECRADRPGYHEDSQLVTLNLFHDAEITKHPEDPVVVGNGDHNGIVTFEIKAYPRPDFEFCYNGTCSIDRRGRVQFRDNQIDETMHTVEFIVHDMSEMDNGNVTLRVTQTERGVNFNRTVMLFFPYKIDVRMDGNIISNSDVPLHIRLRRPIHFDYEIEFVDKNGELLDTMEGEKGKETFQHRVSVHRDTELMARFKIGKVTGPESDAVTIDVTEAPESENGSSTVIIVSVIAVAVVLLTLILSATVIIVCVVWRTKKSSKEEADGGDVENGVGENQMQLPAQNGPHMAMNRINQPQIAVIAATPHDMNGNLAHNIYPLGPYFPRPHFGSASSDHSSAPSRKNSGGTGSESGLGSGMYPYTFSPCASNHFPRCACNCEHDAYHHHVGYQHQEQEPQQPIQHDHSGSATTSQQLTTSSNNNLTAARPAMRRNSSDPNISRHKPSPCRPLDEQRSNKLLSSSSVY